MCTQWHVLWNCSVGGVLGIPTEGHPHRPVSRHETDIHAVAFRQHRESEQVWIREGLDNGYARSMIKQLLC